MKPIAIRSEFAVFFPKAGDVGSELPEDFINSSEFVLGNGLRFFATDNSAPQLPQYSTSLAFSALHFSQVFIMIFAFISRYLARSRFFEPSGL
jgi:hypothetical protein